MTCAEGTLNIKLRGEARPNILKMFPATSPPPPEAMFAPAPLSSDDKDHFKDAALKDSLNRDRLAAL
jgi:hypothetical protein